MSYPGPPQISIRPEVSDQTIQLSWKPPLHTGASPIIAYELFDESKFIRLPKEARSYTATGLRNGVNYTFSIVAINTNGFGDEVYFRTVQPGSKPSVVTDQTYTTDPNGTLSISWTPPKEDGDSTIRWNVVSCHPIDSKAKTISKSLYGEANTAGHVTGLDPTKAYQVIIQAVNDPGYSPPISYLDTIFWGFRPTNIGSLSLWFDMSNPLTLLDTTLTPVLANENPQVTNLKELFSGDYATSTVPAAYLKTGLGSRYPALQCSSIIFKPKEPIIQTNTATFFIVFEATVAPVAPVITVATTLLSDSNAILKITTGASQIDCNPTTPLGFAPSVPNLLVAKVQEATTTFLFESPYTDTTYGTEGRHGTNLSSLGDLTLGGHGAKISEMLAYDAALDEAQCGAVQTYLRQKWGLPQPKPVKPVLSIVVDGTQKGQGAPFSFSVKNAGGPYTYAGDSWTFNNLIVATNTNGAFTTRKGTIGSISVAYTVRTAAGDLLRGTPIFITVNPLIGVDHTSATLEDTVKFVVDLTANTDYMSDAWIMDSSIYASNTKGRCFRRFNRTGVHTITYRFTDKTGATYTSNPVYVTVT